MVNCRNSHCSLCKLAYTHNKAPQSRTEGNHDNSFLSSLPWIAEHMVLIRRLACVRNAQYPNISLQQHFPRGPRVTRMQCCFLHYPKQTTTQASTQKTTNKQTHKQTNKQTDRQTSKQASKQTNKQTQRTSRETDVRTDQQHVKSR